MPYPPPRSSSGSRYPVSVSRSARSASILRAFASKAAASWICDPMCVCAPSSSSSGWSRTARSAARACPPVRETPNFWSSCGRRDELVATGVDARGHAHHDGHLVLLSRPASRASSATRSISAKESTTTRPTPASIARRDLRVRLVVAVQADLRTRDPGTQGDGELAPRAGVDPETFLPGPAGDGDRQEGLARVVDVDLGADSSEGLGEGVAEQAGPVTEVLLVHDEGGRPEVSGEVGRRETGEDQLTVGVRSALVGQTCCSRGAGTCGVPVALTSGALTSAPGRSRRAARGRWRGPGGSRR